MYRTARTPRTLGTQALTPATIIFAGIRYVFLRNGSQIDDSVCDRVSPPECNNNSRRRGPMRYSNVATAIREKKACIPSL